MKKSQLYSIYSYQFNFVKSHRKESYFFSYDATIHLHSASTKLSRSIAMHIMSKGK